MALHRDIYWVGRQWAVTGYGLQAVDQKLKGNFDIEAAGLWQDGLLERMQSERWLNVEDFSKALAIARARYPAPPSEGASSHEHAPSQMQPPKAAIDRRKPVAPPFEMRVERWPAKFIRPWRVGLRRPRS
jgi:hypothetical protein